MTRQRCRCRLRSLWVGKRGVGYGGATVAGREPWRRWAQLAHPCAQGMHTKCVPRDGGELGKLSGLQRFPGSRGAVTWPSKDPLFSQCSPLQPVLSALLKVPAGQFVHEKAPAAL